MSRFARRRTPRVLGIALAATLACVAFGAGSAQALTSVACTGSEGASFSPGLTNTPTSTLTTFAAGYDCVSLTHPSITSGAISTSATLTLSCAALTSGATRTRTIRWNTGETSEYTFTSTIDVQLGNHLLVTRTGSITAGKFNGATTAEEVDVVAYRDNCVTTTGVLSYTGTNVLTITGL
jgi:hypothetical protein